MLALGALPWIGMILLWWFLFRQLQAGGNRAFCVRQVEGEACSPATPPR